MLITKRNVHTISHREHIVYKLTTTPESKGEFHVTRQHELNETTWERFQVRRPNLDCARILNFEEFVVCSPTVVHAYQSPLMAALYNIQHAAIRNPTLWRCVAKIEDADRYDTKLGCSWIKPLEKLAFPTNRVLYAAIYQATKGLRLPGRYWGPQGMRILIEDTSLDSPLIQELFDRFLAPGCEELY